MTYNLTIGNQKEACFLYATDKIANDVSQGHVFDASAKIHGDLFGGGPFKAKGFSDLFSLRSLSSKIGIQEMFTSKLVTTQRGTPKKLSKISGEAVIPTVYKPDGKSYNLIRIEKKISFSAVLGILEGIPIIGSAIGAIHFLARIPLMLASYNHLQQVSAAYINNENGDEVANAQKVFTAMVDFATQHYYLGGSALAIIPGLKPLVRLIQGIVYNCRTPVKPAPISKEAIAREISSSPAKPLKPTKVNIKNYREHTVKYSKSDLPVPPPRPPSIPKHRLPDLVQDSARLQKKRIRSRKHDYIQQLRRNIEAFQPKLTQGAKTERS